METRELTPKIPAYLDTDPMRTPCHIHQDRDNWRDICGWKCDKCLQPIRCDGTKHWCQK